MSTWGEILNELNAPENQQPNGRPDFDGVRRKYLAQLHSHTGRAVILYASAFSSPAAQGVSPDVLSITLGDMQGFMEANSGITGPELDLILHSPGGSAEAAESIIEYLRSRFEHIRVIVPMAAMSAATMMALGADVIVMGKHSQLGPIDPQFTLVTPEGPRTSPAKAILDQFERAKDECKDPAVLPAWLPILRGYAPGLLSQCRDSQRLAESMVKGWLEAYMFKGDSGAAEKAKAVAAWFADYDNFGSHGRPVRIEKGREEGLKVEALEDDQELQDAVLSVFHATSHTFVQTGTVKLVENHLGKAFVHIQQRALIAREAPEERGRQAQRGNRAQRRRAQRKR